MLADKFWLNPDSKMIWVGENHIKTILENPVLFEFDGQKELNKFINYYKLLFGSDVVNYKDLDQFYKIANDPNYSDKLGVFEYFVYEKGFVWCEYSDRILHLRSNSIDFLKEGLDDLKDSLHEVDVVHLILMSMKGTSLQYRLVGKKEIDIFLQEMILPRKAKIFEKSPTVPEKKLSWLGKIINILYAKKTKTNLQSSKIQLQ